MKIRIFDPARDISFWMKKGERDKFRKFWEDLKDRNKFTMHRIAICPGRSDEREFSSFRYYDYSPNTSYKGVCFCGEDLDPGLDVLTFEEAKLGFSKLLWFYDRKNSSY